MLARLVRGAFAPRNLAATAVLTLAASGIAYAAIGSTQITNNSISGLDIKNESLGTADIKNDSLRGRDFVTNSIAGREIDESSLGKVPSAAAADSATNATNATNATTASTATTATLADKAIGQSRFATGFVTVSAEDNDPAVARDAATPILLATAGTLSLQGLCFRDVDSDDVVAEVIATTTVDGAVMDSWWDRLKGGTTFNNASFLFTDTTRSTRQVLTSVALTEGHFGIVDTGNGQAPFTMIGIDGSYLTGGVHVSLRNGSPAGSPAALPGTEHSCSFVGEVTHSGNA